MNPRLLLPALLLCCPFVLCGAPKEEGPRLVEKHIVKWESLRSVTSVAISPDGKFAYAAAFNSSAVTIFKRNIETGNLLFEKTVTGPSLKSAVSFRLSADGEYGVASAFGSNAITLFKRDAATGDLKQLDVARKGEGNNGGLDFVTEAQFSPDGRAIYTSAANGIGVYLIEGEKLVCKQLETADRRLRGVRDACVSPDGKYVYAASSQSNAVGVFEVNPQTHLLRAIQVLIDGQDGCEALEGAFRVTTSPKGEHIYVSSGRFGGDQAVSVFARQGDGTLEIVEEHVNDTDGFTDFKGGNGLGVSPDGTHVYALATESDRIATFSRDPKTGKLTFRRTEIVGDEVAPGCPTLCFSPDGQFLYVADENANAIVVYRMP